MDHSKENTYFGLQIPSQLSNNMNFINILEFLGETQMTKDGYATLVEQELQNESQKHKEINEELTKLRVYNDNLTEIAEECRGEELGETKEELRNMFNGPIYEISKLVDFVMPEVGDTDTDSTPTKGEKGPLEISKEDLEEMIHPDANERKRLLGEWEYNIIPAIESHLHAKLLQLNANYSEIVKRSLRLSSETKTEGKSFNLLELLAMADERIAILKEKRNTQTTLNSQGVLAIRDLIKDNLEKLQFVVDNKVLGGETTVLESKINHVYLQIDNLCKKQSIIKHTMIQGLYSEERAEALNAVGRELEKYIQQLAIQKEQMYHEIIDYHANEEKMAELAEEYRTLRLKIQNKKLDLAKFDDI